MLRASGVFLASGWNKPSTNRKKPLRVLGCGWESGVPHLGVPRLRLRRHRPGPGAPAMLVGCRFLEKFVGLGWGGDLGGGGGRI